MDITAAQLLDDVTRLQIEAALLATALQRALAEPLPPPRPPRARPPRLALAA